MSFPENVSINSDNEYITFGIEVNENSSISIDNGKIEFKGDSEIIKEYLSNNANLIEKITDISELTASLEIKSEISNDTDFRTSLSDISIDDNGNISIDYKAVVSDDTGVPMAVTKSLGISKDGHSVSGDLNDFKYNNPDTKIDSFIELKKEKSDIDNDEKKDVSIESYRFDKSVDSQIVSAFTSVFHENSREVHNSEATVNRDIKDYVYTAKGFQNPVRLVAVKVPDIQSDLYVHAVVGIDGKVLVDTSNFEFNSFLNSKDVSFEDKQKIDEYKANFSFGEVYEKRGNFDGPIERSYPLSDMRFLVSNKKLSSMIETTDKWGNKTKTVENRPDLQFPGYEKMDSKEAFLYGSQHKTIQKIANSISNTFNDVTNEDKIRDKIANINEVSSISEVLKGSTYENDAVSKKISDFITNAELMSTDTSEFSSNVDFIKSIDINASGSADISERCKEIGTLIENKIAIISQAESSLEKVDIPNVAIDKYLSVIADYNETKPEHALVIKDEKVYNEYGISNDKTFNPDERTNFDFSKLHYTEENREDFEKILSDKDNSAGIIDAYIDTYSDVGYSEFQNYVKDGKEKEEIDNSFLENAIERELNGNDIQDAIMDSLSDDVSEFDLRKAASDLSNLDASDEKIFEKTRAILEPILKYDVEKSNVDTDKPTQDKEKTEKIKPEHEKDLFESKKPTKEELWSDFVAARDKYEKFVAKIPLGISSARNTFAAVLKLKAVVAGKNADATTADLRNSNFRDKSDFLTTKEDFGTHRKINTLDVISSVYSILTTNLLESVLFTVIGAIANAIETKADKMREDKVEVEKREISIDGNNFELRLEIGKDERMLSIHLIDDSGKVISEKLTEVKVFENDKITESFIERYIDLNSEKIDYLKDAEFLKGVLKDEDINISKLDTADKVYEKVIAEKLDGNLSDISVVMKIDATGDKSFELSTTDKGNDKRIDIPAFLSEKIENQIIDKVEVVEKDSNISSYEKGTEKFNEWVDGEDTEKTEQDDKNDENVEKEETTEEKNVEYETDREKEIVELLGDKPENCTIELNIDEYGDIKLIVTQDDEIKVYDVDTDKIMDSINTDNIDAITINDRIASDKEDNSTLAEVIEDCKSGKLDNSADLGPDIILPELSVDEWKSLDTDEEKIESLINVVFGDSAEEVMDTLSNLITGESSEEVLDSISQAVAVEISDLGLSSEEYDNIISAICDMDVDDDIKLKVLDTVDLLNTYSDGVFFDDKYIVGCDDERKVFELDNESGEWKENTDIEKSPLEAIEAKLDEFLENFEPTEIEELKIVDIDNSDDIPDEEVEVFDLGDIENEKFDSPGVEYVSYDIE